ncbi:hypothetical protein GQ457_08G026890 [Hibiscus cannabinus]
MHVVFDDNLLRRKDSCDDDDVGSLQSNGGEPSSKVNEIPNKEEAQDPPLEALKDMNKLDESGNIVRNKARLVAQGYTQEERIDFDETYAPVARMEAIRMLLAFACHHEFKLFQMDIKSAFLNGFIKKYFAKLMQGKFEMSMLGELSFFLGLQIKQRKDDIFINQAKYIKEKLKMFGLENVKPQATPMSSSIKLDKDEEERIDCSMDLALPLTDPIDAKSLRKSKFHLVDIQALFTQLNANLDARFNDIDACFTSLNEDVNDPFNSLDARHNAFETRFKVQVDSLHRVETELSAYHLESSTHTFGVQGLGGNEDAEEDDDDTIPPP